MPKAPGGLLYALVEAAGTLEAEGEYVRMKAHRVALGEDETRALVEMERVFQAAGLEVPAVGTVVAGAGIDAVRARALLEMLFKRGRGGRVSTELVFHSSALERLEEMVAGHEGELFSIATFKSWTGISRKYAVPLLEHLDRRKLTRRQGEQRLVLSRQRPMG